MIPDKNDDSRYHDMYLKGWSAAVPTMKEDVGKMLAIMEAAHNKEQHALNGNIFPKAAPDSIKAVHALIDCNKTWPTIKQPDIPIQEQGREIQEVREIRTNIMLACDRTYTVPTRAGTFQQCIINVSALARNGMWEAKKETLFEIFPLYKQKILEQAKIVSDKLRDTSLKCILKEYLDIAPGIVILYYFIFLYNFYFI